MCYKTCHSFVSYVISSLCSATAVACCPPKQKQNIFEWSFCCLTQRLLLTKADNTRFSFDLVCLRRLFDIFFRKNNTTVHPHITPHRKDTFLTDSVIMQKCDCCRVCFESSSMIVSYWKLCYRRPTFEAQLQKSISMTSVNNLVQKSGTKRANRAITERI